MVKVWQNKSEHCHEVVKILTALILLGQFFTATSNRPSGFFWQFTDVHWDQRYSRDGDPSKMCHQETDKDLPHHQSLGQNMISPNGQYGTYTCDAPWDLVDLSIRGMADKNNNPDFILWTGDNTPHVKDPSPDWNVVFSSLRNVSTMLRQHFPNATILPVLGNHDSYPADLYPSLESDFYRAYLSEGKWDQLLSSSARESFGRCGFYAMEIDLQLQVVVLNTNLYNAPDNLTHNVDDPCGQLVWLEQQLQLAQIREKKVLLAAHIPPGYFERWIGPPFFNPEQNDRFVQIIHSYSDVILTQVYGHTHTDSFRIFGESASQVGSVAFVSPSVTPWLHEGGVNPGLRLYQYTSTDVVDYWQFYLNLTQLMDPAEIELPRSRRSVDDVAQWQLLYQATNAYGVQDLSAANVLSMYAEMLSDATVFERYYFFNTVGHVFKECDAVCVRDHLCVMSHLTTADMDACLAGRNVFFRYDAEMTARFAEIAQRAELSQRNPVTTTLLCLTVAAVIGVVCSFLLKCRPNVLDGANQCYSGPKIRFASINTVNKGTYRTLDCEDVAQQPLV